MSRTKRASASVSTQAVTQDPDNPSRPWSDGFTRSQLSGAEQRTGQMQERLQDVGATLIADGQAPVGQQPGQGAFDLPAVAAQPLAGLHPTPGDPRADAPAAQRPPTGQIVVALVGVQLGRSPAGSTGPAAWPDDRWDGIHQLLQELGVVGVGGRQPHGQRDAVGVDHQVVLGAWLAPVDRIRAGQFPPRRARTLTLSIAALDQSTWPSSPSQSSSR